MNEVETNLEDKKPIFDMGSKTTEIFKGNSESTPIKKMYAESAQLFAETITSKFLPKPDAYSMVDIGAAKGELLSEIIKLLPGYTFNIISTDTNTDAISTNINPGEKIVADAESLPIADNSIDIVLMRYVLQFNQLKSQEKILNEIVRVSIGMIIIQHGGSDDAHPKEYRATVDKIFNNDQIPQLSRKGMFYTSAQEVEALMVINRIKFKKIQSQKVEGLSQIFIERYDLNKQQAELVKSLLSGKDYIIQTTWVIQNL